jgi:3-oxoacyl-[acyl-carrier-protein] synthase II
MAGQDQLRREVVITGIGIVSPIGIGIDDFTVGLRSGTSGIARLQNYSYLPVPQQIAGEVKGFEAAKYARTREQKKSIRVMCREIQLAVASASLALDQAGVEDGVVAPERLGIDFGANLMLSPPEDLVEACGACVDANDHQFHYERWGDTGMGKMFPLWLLKYLPNMPACHIGIAADARGPNNSITLDEASGNLVLGEASRVIARGHADMMIAGATGTRVHAVKSIHAALWDTLAAAESDPAAAYRPFDRNRNGQVVAEGACTFILEEAEHARRRGVKIYGKILGAGSSCVLDRAGNPDVCRALVLAMHSALRDAGVSPGDVGHINAHGLGTRESDRLEAVAIAEVFGNYASKVPVTALKSQLGNSGSGCGTLELAGSLVGLQHGGVPPTLNYSSPDPECPLNVVSGEPLETSNRLLLKVNVTRMGQASALVVCSA